jgi:hypothetical protein
MLLTWQRRVPRKGCAGGCSLQTAHARMCIGRSRYACLCTCLVIVFDTSLSAVASAVGDAVWWLLLTKDVVVAPDELSFWLLLGVSCNFVRISWLVVAQHHHGRWPCGARFLSPPVASLLAAAHTFGRSCQSGASCVMFSTMLL